ncbi:hypothetical protein XPR_2606 [Xanthomonas arboricola pv. pruni MAFF 301420]|uniref:Uncharacterized protein n=2 Tax=Xanthomonas arboricola pv. pruni TaxID=69929 RepID=W4SHI3_9XANT|nr:hypothetical protein XPU_1688 [Xanthomonas arboricola pv. pruni str. MAFF 311562]GAE55971.1 hypothetical protein XPR_2606 [Xanthomonas arboricola pv. pruni MAFF 301420]GAE60687.1 hypothetical protein XPN_2593 [Xanthomonas arboricola pv. pruni MAFF 301427]
MAASAAGKHATEFSETMGTTCKVAAQTSKAHVIVRNRARVDPGNAGGRTVSSQASATHPINP